MDTGFASIVIAVIDESSIADAARRLGITQGRARRIKTLENERSLADPSALALFYPQSGRSAEAQGNPRREMNPTFWVTLTLNA